MHRSSNRILAAAPHAVSRPMRPRSGRHRASELWKPRPTDLCADRVEALARCAAMRGPIDLPDGRRLDARVLASIADEQRTRESELLETIGLARDAYETYQRATRGVRDLLLAGIAQLDGRIERSDAAARTALRTAKLRRPSKTALAQLQTLARERSGDDGA